MGTELVLKRMDKAEDVVEYFCIYHDPSKLCGAFPSLKDAQCLLDLLEGHDYSLLYDVKTGKVYREDRSKGDKGGNEKEEPYSFDLAVRFCLDMAVELEETAREEADENEDAGSDRMSDWHSRIMYAKCIENVEI